MFMNWESNRNLCPISKVLNAVLTRINVNICSNLSALSKVLAERKSKELRAETV